MIILLKLLQFIFGIIFRLPAPHALRLMRLAGEITYRIARLTPAKKMVIKNMQAILPGRDFGPPADQLLRNVAYSVFEMLCVPFFQETHFNSVCKINGLENVDLALSRRKGAVIVSMHTGNYELMPIALSSRGYTVNSVMKAPKEPLFEFLKPIRSCKGTKLINVLEADMYRETLKALGNNELVCLGVDTGALEGRHETIPFLGRSLPAATGWLTLAQRSEAAIVPVQVKRENGKMVISFSEPLNLYRDNREEIMYRVKQFFENFIKNHPEQWLMFLNEYETKRMVEGK